MAIGAGIVVALGTVIGSLAVRALTAVGVGVVSYTGLSVAMDAVMAKVVEAFSGTGATIMNIVGILEVDTAISIVFSALVVRAALRGLTAVGGGTVKRMTVQ